MLYDFTYIRYLSSKFIEIESQMVVAKGQEKWEVVSPVSVLLDEKNPGDCLHDNVNVLNTTKAYM